MMLLFNLVILVFLISFLSLLVWNLKLLKRSPKNKKADCDLPFVSVLVPMRNEEKNAEACINSLLLLDYPEYEIVVLNDDSTDNTGNILTELSKKNNKLRVIENHGLPPGWMGKTYACTLLAEEAKGEFLLFTDADVYHNSKSLKNIVKLSLEYNADLLSAVPEQIMNSFAEKLLVPFLYFIMFVFLPLFMIRFNKFPRFSAAIGQYMLFKKQAYEKIGGHGAVEDSIIEDVHLARLIKKNNLKLLLIDGTAYIKCKMYNGLNEIFSGFSKNIFAGLGHSLLLLSAVILISTILFVYPFFALFYYLPNHEQSLGILYLLLSQIIVIYTMRYLLLLKFKQNFLSVILHPFGMIMIMILSIRSFWSSAILKEAVWKGRKYRIGER